MTVNGTGMGYRTGGHGLPLIIRGSITTGGGSCAFTFDAGGTNAGMHPGTGTAPGVPASAVRGKRRDYAR